METTAHRILLLGDWIDRLLLEPESFQPETDEDVWLLPDAPIDIQHTDDMGEIYRALFYRYQMQGAGNRELISSFETQISRLHPHPAGIGVPSHRRIKLNCLICAIRHKAAEDFYNHLQEEALYDRELESCHADMLGAGRLYG